MSNGNSHSDATSGISRLRLLAMAAASGIAVANIYYNQPMLGLIESDFSGQSMTNLIPTATQLGYALGLFLLLPLGDLVQRRRLIVLQFLVLAVALVGAALAPSALLLVVASFLVGASATVAQQIVPFAASLAPPDKRGATIGTVMAGVLSGILLSRTLSGFVGEHAGWRDMFWLGVPLALLAAALMQASLPKHRPALKLAYPAAIRSLFHIWMREPQLRISTLVQAALFAGFTVFWTILALYLASPAFELGADIAGLFGIVGAVGIFAAPLAGRMADSRGPHLVIRIGAVLSIAAWVLFGLSASIAALVIGVIVLDFGVQSAMISNQHVIYALDGEARSRLNTIYMTGMFLGGAFGSAMATVAWSYDGWVGVSLFGIAMGCIALGIKMMAPGPVPAQSRSH